MKTNIWTCEKCKRSVHVNVPDEGTSPFMLECYGTPGCDGSMQSRMFRSTPQWANIPITHEFWEPTVAELDILCEEMSELEENCTRNHVRDFKLLLRELPGWKAQLDRCPVPSRRAPHHKAARENLVR